MSDYTELVQRLRDSQHNNIIAGWEGDARDDREAADAITKLRAERDNAIAECVMHIGNAKALRAERDSLRQHLHDEHQRHIGTMDERDALAALLREARYQLGDNDYEEALQRRIDSALAAKDKP